MDRRPRWRRFLTYGIALVLSFALTAAATALSELIKPSSSAQSWWLAAGAFVAAVLFAVVGNLVSVPWRGRRPRERPRVTDPQLRDLLSELWTEQARFDDAMRARSR